MKLLFSIVTFFVFQCAFAQEFFKGVDIVKHTESNLKLGLKNGDYFGRKMANIGDLDNDGIDELAVCAHATTDTINNQNTTKGTLYILSFNSAGNLKGSVKINENEGGFSGTLTSNFALDVAGLGDLDGNGVEDLMVSEQNADNSKGALWVLFMQKGASKKANFDFSVSSQVKIAPDGVGGFLAKSAYVGPNFANALTAVGDLDGDGIQDIVSGVGRTENQTGSLWVLFMNKNGTVKDYQEISNREGNLPYKLVEEQFFGVSVDAIGDINGDDIPDIAVGSHQNDVDGNDDGSVYTLCLNKNGTVKKAAKLGTNLGGFGFAVPEKSFMGFGIGGKVDLNQDGIGDLLIGANGDATAGDKGGAVYICILDSNGKATRTEKLTPADTLVKDYYGAGDRFGSSIVSIGDINSDGYPDLAIGAMTDNEGSFCIVLSDAPVGKNKIPEKVNPWDISQNRILGDDANISVYNLDGQLVKTGKLFNGGYNLITELEHCPKSIYLVQVKNNSSRQVFKVLVQ